MSHLDTKPPKNKLLHCVAEAWQLHLLGFAWKTTDDYIAKANLIEKVLDFVQLGGPHLHNSFKADPYRAHVVESFITPSGKVRIEAYWT